MPELMDHGYRVRELTDASIHLINTEGVGSFTLRRIAAVARLSPSSVTSHLENKKRMTDLVVKDIASRLERRIGDDVRDRGVVAFVPDEELLPLVRAWVAMCELARADEDLALSVAYIEQRHRDLVHWACRLAPGDTVTLDSMHALVVGLWTAMCARSEPMTPERAAAVLRRTCAALGVPTHPET